MTTFYLRRANSYDISYIKQIADRNRDSLGFLLRPKIEEAIATGRIMIAFSEVEIFGFVIYRHRKIDLQTTLSDICVDQQWRNRGVGKAMIQALYAECSSLGRKFIQLKCPEDLSANSFYEKVGFSHTHTEPGRDRRLNVWRMCVSLEN